MLSAYRHGTRAVDGCRITICGWIPDARRRVGSTGVRSNDIDCHSNCNRKPATGYGRRRGERLDLQIVAGCDVDCAAAAMEMRAVGSLRLGFGINDVD